MTKKKIAGVSYDEWLEEIIPVPKSKLEKKKYDNKLIAFLDVLGIKGLIETNKDGKEHIAIDKIEQIRKIVESSTNIVQESENIDYLQISDSFVFVSGPKTVILLLKLLSTIQTRIIHEANFLLRGAITIGDAIIEDESKYIIGPAYIQAYQLQENDAIYPRIIADNSVINEMTKCKEKIIDYLERDLDKEYFIDYIKVFMKDESKRKEDMKIMLRRNNIFGILTERFLKYNRKEEHGICQKYGWTIQYYKKKGVWENGS